MYLELHGLESSMAQIEDRWALFLRHYLAVIEDWPLRCSGHDLSFTDKVVVTALELEPSPERVLTIEWSWVSKVSGMQSKALAFM